jgi:hypothetical protein
MCNIVFGCHEWYGRIFRTVNNQDYGTFSVFLFFSEFHLRFQRRVLPVMNKTGATHCGIAKKKWAIDNHSLQPGCPIVAIAALLAKSSKHDVAFHNTSQLVRKRVEEADAKKQRTSAVSDVFQRMMRVAVVLFMPKTPVGMCEEVETVRFADMSLPRETVRDSSARGSSRPRKVAPCRGTLAIVKFCARVVWLLVRLPVGDNSDCFACGDGDPWTGGFESPPLGGE